MLEGGENLQNGNQSIVKVLILSSRNKQIRVYVYRNKVKNDRKKVEIPSLLPCE